MRRCIHSSFDYTEFSGAILAGGVVQEQILFMADDNEAATERPRSLCQHLRQFFRACNAADHPPTTIMHHGSISSPCNRLAFRGKKYFMHPSPNASVSTEYSSP